MTQVQGKWLERRETQQVMAAISDTGARAFFVGGCVRNALLGVDVSDVDIATDARPEQVMEIAKAAELKAVPTGIEHGTVTIVSGRVGYEVTTFRKDIETDGRRAVVSFSSDMADDARRRDFTMNAIYADASGAVIDPLGGLDDLHARRVRFIEDADARIKEDYLRILRFFRFYAWYGDPDQGLDREGLAAVCANLDGIDTLSSERVGAEVKKLLAAHDPAPSVGAMAQAGVLTRILPGCDHRFLAPLTHLDAHLPSDPIRRLAALGGDKVAERLRLSRADKRQLSLMRQCAQGVQAARELGYRHGEQMAIDALLVRSASLEAPPPDGFESDAAFGAAQVFEIRAADLMPDYQGVALGKKLDALTEEWIASGFSLSKEQLLS